MRSTNVVKTYPQRILSSDVFRTEYIKKVGVKSREVGKSR